MRGNEGFARFAGIAALGGAFYTATYITSYPGGAPPYLVVGLLAGTAAGVLACAFPRSSGVLTTAAVLLGFAFTGALIRSGVGFGPGFVLMILAARRTAYPDDFAFLHPRDPSAVARGSLDWFRSADRREARASQGFGAWRDRVVVLPDSEPVIRLPEADVDMAPRVSSDGLIQAGPPGVIGRLGTPPSDPLSD